MKQKLRSCHSLSVEDGARTPFRYQNLQMLKSLVCSATMFAFTCAHPPVYFKLPLDYLQYLTQCKCWVNSCYAVLFRESLYMFRRDAIFFQMFLICYWLNYGGRTYGYRGLNIIHFNTLCNYYLSLNWKKMHTLSHRNRRVEKKQSPNTPEAEAGGSWVQGQPGLHNDI
jgi:hypothetical protein